MTLANWARFCIDQMRGTKVTSHTAEPSAITPQAAFL